MRFPLLLLLAVPAVAAPPKSPLDGVATQKADTRSSTLGGLARAKTPLTKAEVAVVVELLREDPYVLVRNRAAELLGMGQADLKLALTALVETLDDSAEDKDVRLYAAQ